MKFSIVTPSYKVNTNWLRQTIEGVVSQSGDFDIEYIIVHKETPGDDVKGIVDEYKKTTDQKKQCNSITLTYIPQGKSQGMYGAINEGFAIATGDIYAWINADDVYEPNAFSYISEVFEQAPETMWVKGVNRTIDEQGKILREGHTRPYHRDWLQKGIYGQEAYFVEQDTVFWKKELWEKTGNIPEHFTSAGDYWLWIQFANLSPLTLLNHTISSFRKSPTQLSKNISQYKSEQKRARPKKYLSAYCAQMFFTLYSRITGYLPCLRKTLSRLYTLFFFIKLPFEYIEIVDGTYAKLKSYSMLVSPK